ncbi:MAG: CRISPR-associated helicase Cas3' [Clostridia bacterium]|nr:CRISPR-associated helicase Cas3' [Clostridia bacterium]
MQYLAHICGDRQQSVLEHLSGTAKRCRTFASAFQAEEQGELVGLAHDLGKYSDAFQQRLRGGHPVDHATAGAVECLNISQIPAAFAVAGHHGGLPDGGANGDTADQTTLIGRCKRREAHRLPDYSAWEKEIRLPQKAAYPSFFGKDALTDAFYTRMLYSCLVDSDYLDTEEFIYSGKVERTPYVPLSDLLKRLETFIAPFWPPKTPLNEKRCKVLSACMDKASMEKGLFTLTVPTGGGKTIASLAFALRHAVHHGMNHVVYVIPYTSIIEQNARVFKNILGEENVVEHHFNVAFDGDKDTDAVGYRHALSTENWDAPIIVTTAVQFFESLYSNRPSKCRKLHNLACSVFIFDEAQVIPGEHLRPCVSAISQLVRHYGSTAVLCTATQPSINDLLSYYSGGMEIRELCPDLQEQFAQLRRVTFSSRGDVTAEILASELCKFNEVLCIVNSRNAARRIYELLPKEGSYHLSTLMVSEHRRQILEEIRRRLKDGLLCRVVSTSLIEAGVDVDFPTVYRELAGLDSMVQAAGRCNREGKRPREKSLVVIFRGDWPVPPLFGAPVGAAVEVLSEGRDPSDPKTIEMYFRAWRSLIGDNMDKYGVIDAFLRGISGCMMPFRSVAERFRFIGDDTTTVYVPLEKGAELINRILEGERNRELFRKVGQYGVSVYERQYKDLLAAGAVIPIDEGSAVLTDITLYNEMTGLSPEIEWGKAHFA